MRLALALSAALFFSSLAEHPSAQTKSSSNLDAVASTERKLEHVQRNAALSHPDPAPTEFTERELNSYFAAGRVKLPAGVRSVTFQGLPGVVNALAHVDFDQLKAGRRSSNPLLSVFSGVHDVAVASHARGRGGQGFVHVDSVSLDGIEIPEFVLRLFVEKYLQPKYPDVGIDSRFRLPARIDSATVGSHQLTVIQK